MGSKSFLKEEVRAEDKKGNNLSSVPTLGTRHFYTLISYLQLLWERMSGTFYRWESWKTEAKSSLLKSKMVSDKAGNLIPGLLPCDGSFKISKLTRAGDDQIIGLNILGEPVRVFLEQINILFHRLRKSDCPSQCGWTPSNLSEAWIE